MKIRPGYILIILALIIFGSALWLNSINNQRVELPYEVLASNVPYDIHFEVPTSIVPNRPTKIEISATQNGQPTSALEDSLVINATIMNEAGTDFDQFFSLEDPNNIQDKSLQITHTFVGGDYDFWVEINDISTRDHHGNMAVNFMVHGKFTVEPRESGVALKEINQVHPRPDRIIKLEKQTLSAGHPAQLSFNTTDTQGNQVPLISDFDHFYVIASAKEDFNLQRHVDQDDSVFSQGNIVTQNFTFPAPGYYAVWVTVYEDGGSTETQKIASDLYDATFVVKVN